MAIKDQTITKDYALYNGDCIEVMNSFPDEKIHLSIYSPPFGGLYHYSSNDRDLSNAFDYQDFFKHYRFVVKELNRITLSGRITAVHCTDIPASNNGKDYLTDFAGDIIKLHAEENWHFIARHTIFKEPLWVRNRTMTKNLSHMTCVKDAAYAGVASADYLLIFRKKGLNKIPIQNPTGFEFYAGECPIPKEYSEYKNFKGDQKQNRWSHMIWRRYASSVWDDIKMDRVLPFQDCKEPDDEKHVHPLQLDIIDRCVMLRSNKGENVFTPFMGVGSEVYGAVIQGRKGIGVELKSSYYRQAIKNLETAKNNNIYKSENIQTEMFDEEEIDL
jgi:DNA modification methylase